ncbi:MAG: nucleotidyltransferase [Pseudomonadota bacterium]|nr:nucleotidyltransferase [Pseudomonadota bacterium]
MNATGPGQSLLLLLDVVAVLNEQGIEYGVVGALAASVYGTVRATTDADALVSVSPPDLPGLETMLREAGFTTELSRGDFDDPIPALIAISDQFGNRVDLLGGLRGLDPEAFDRTNSVAFHGTTLRIIGREDFIGMKCFAGGPLDIADAQEAIRAAEPPIDLDLVRRITRRFGRPAADALERLLAE